MPKFKSLLISGALLLSLLSLPFGGIASATQNLTTIEIPVSTIVKVPPGTKKLLASEAVADELIGQSCQVSAEAQNQGSVHPGNDLIVASDGTAIAIRDVEGQAGGVTAANGSLVLGNDITVTLVMGEDGIFSAGITVTFDCRQDEPKPPQTPKKVSVCRNNTVITIDETERLESDTDAPCPQVQGKTTSLPNTGIESAFGGFAGLSALGYSTMVYIESKRALRTSRLRKLK